MVLPASVTPLLPGGKLDPDSLAALIARFREAGCHGIVVGGTNGEGPSLGTEEKVALVRETARASSGLEIVIGVAGSSLEDASSVCRQAADAGADRVLLMPPGYFREASEDGIVRWFEAVLDRTPIPAILYNLPQRTGIRLNSKIVGRLAGHDRVDGLKDSSGERENLAPFKEAMAGKRLFVGNETLLIEALEAGWSGTISGAANVIPDALVSVVRAYSSAGAARARFDDVLPAINALRSVPQPGANKLLLRRLGIIRHGEMLLPLLPPAADSVNEIWKLVEPIARAGATAVQ